MRGKVLSDGTAGDNLITVGMQSSTTDSATKADVLWLFLFPWDARISRVHLGTGMMPRFLPAVELLQFLLFSFCGVVWSWHSSGIFSSGTAALHPSS